MTSDGVHKSKKFKPVIRARDFATVQSLKLSEKTLAKTEEANNFLTDFADVILFIGLIIKGTFSRNFEFKEFLRQCFHSASSASMAARSRSSRPSLR